MMQKSFSIASAAINITKAISDGWASGADLGTKLSAVATIIAQTGNILADISSVTMSGFKTGGYTGNYGTNQIAGVVHGQEYVLNAEATKRVGKGTLDALNSGARLGDEININVILKISNDGSGEVQVDGQAKEKELATVIANAVRAIIIKEKRQGGLLS